MMKTDYHYSWRRSTYTPGIVQAILNNENGCHYLKYVYMILMKKEIWICT